MRTLQNSKMLKKTYDAQQNLLVILGNFERLKQKTIVCRGAGRGSGRAGR